MTDWAGQVPWDLVRTDWKLRRVSQRCGVSSSSKPILRENQPEPQVASLVAITTAALNVRIFSCCLGCYWLDWYLGQLGWLAKRHLILLVWNLVQSRSGSSKAMFTMSSTSTALRADLVVGRHASTALNRMNYNVVFFCNSHCHSWVSRYVLEWQKH